MAAPYVCPHAPAWRPCDRKRPRGRCPCWTPCCKATRSACPCWRKPKPPTRIACEEILRQLELIGVSESQIGMVVTDETRGKSFNIEHHTKADQGVAAGATVGGVVGAVLAAIAGAGTIAIPGLNVVVAGAIVSALAGLGAGATAGGIIGGLIGLGVPEHEAKLHEGALRTGSILLAVEAKDSSEARQVEAILRQGDAQNIAA